MSESVIVQYVRNVISDAFPMLQEPGHGLHRSGIGGLSNRGRYHPTGRAADIFFNEERPYERYIGDRIFRMFHTYAAEIGTDHVIWRRQIWSHTKPTVREYPGASPHTNHIHVFFLQAAANTRPDRLRTEVAAIKNAYIETMIQRGDAARA